MLAVENCCYVAVCLAAQGAPAPTGEERGGGISWRPPAYSLLQTGLWMGSRKSAQFRVGHERSSLSTMLRRSDDCLSASRMGVYDSVHSNGGASAPPAMEGPSFPESKRCAINIFASRKKCPVLRNFLLFKEHITGLLGLFNRYLNRESPRPLCSRLRPDVRDRQTDVRRQTSDAHNRLMPPTIGAGELQTLR